MMLMFNWQKRIWNTYYSDAFDVCKNRHFQLIPRCEGINFKLADIIAGDSHQLSDARLDAAIIDVFQSFYPNVACVDAL